MRSLTFLFVATTLFSLVSAQPNSRHTRMIKKRATNNNNPFIDLNPDPNSNANAAPVLGVGQDPKQVTNPKNNLNATASAVNSAGNSQQTGLQISLPIDSILDPGQATQSQSDSASAASQSSTDSVSTSAAPSSASSIPFVAAVPTSLTNPFADSQAPQVATITSTVDPAQTSDASADANHTVSATSNNGIPKTTIIILACIGGGVVLIGIIWTVIRKWKFRPSNEFEDRLNPINWDPTSAGDGIMIERSNERPGMFRPESRSSNRSFHSADVAHTNNSNLIPDLPPHDFTAGGRPQMGAYADLHRGPSPGPQRAYNDYGSMRSGYGY